MEDSERTEAKKAKSTPFLRFGRICHCSIIHSTSALAQVTFPDTNSDAEPGRIVYVCDSVRTVQRTAQKPGLAAANDMRGSQCIRVATATFHLTPHDDRLS